MYLWAVSTRHAFELLFVSVKDWAAVDDGVPLVYVMCPRPATDLCCTNPLLLPHPNRELMGRCVLLHGLFEVWGHGRDQEEAVKDATT